MWVVLWWWEQPGWWLELGCGAGRELGLSVELGAVGAGMRREGV